MTKIIGSAALTAADPEGENLTTKGDLHGFSSENTRIPIGDNDQVLTADSAQALGLKWAASPTSILSAQSDLLYASSANTLARLAKGTASQVLTMNAGATAPEWAAAPGKLELLDVHTATGTESTYTFTENEDFDNYSNFIVIIQGGATAALQLQMIVNANETSNHHYSREYYTGGSITVTEVNDEDFYEVASTNIIAGTNSFYGIIDIRLNDNDEKYALYRANSCSYASVRWERYYGMNSGIGTGDLSSIQIKTSTSTWIAGTRISIYGYKTT